MCVAPAAHACAGPAKYVDSVQVSQQHGHIMQRYAVQLVPWMQPAEMYHMDSTMDGVRNTVQYSQRHGCIPLDRFVMQSMQARHVKGNTA